MGYRIGAELEIYLYR